MNVVLLRVADADDRRETNVTGTYPPLALAYLGAALRQAGFHPVLLDGEAPLRPVRTLMEELPRDIGLIGITSTTLSWPVVRRAGEELRRRLPGIPIIVGGPQVTAFPRETLEHSSFDLGVIGDGEWSLVEIARRVEAGESLAGIPGTVYRDGDEIRVDESVHWMTSLDALPMPALELLPLHRYRSVVVQEPFVTLLTSRGCPYKCSFCSQIYMGDKFRFHSAERVLDEMERAERAFNAREIVLFDETFGANRRIAFQVCEGIPRRQLTFRWNARTRIDLLSDDLLEAMRSAGCYMLHLGIESGNQRILDKMRKGITLDQVDRVVHTAHRLGFQLHGYFMLGYPGETRAEVEETVRFSRSLPLDWASYTVTIPNPRTLLQEQAEAEGLLAPGFWQEYVAGRTDGTIPYLSSAECDVSYLSRVKRDAYLRFYLRPGTLTRQSAVIVRSGGAQRLFDAGLLWLRELL
jgi:anaerobic magnesium-protoporphyrin IX monomethyl ester cyclase